MLSKLCEISILAEDELKEGLWCMPDMFVTTRRTCPIEDVVGHDGIIRTVQKGAARVYYSDLEENDQVVPFKYLLPVKPQQDDRVSLNINYYYFKNIRSAFLLANTKDILEN